RPPGGSRGRAGRRARWQRRSRARLLGAGGGQGDAGEVSLDDLLPVGQTPGEQDDGRIPLALEGAELRAVILHVVARLLQAGAEPGVLGLQLVNVAGRVQVAAGGVNHLLDEPPAEVAGIARVGGQLAEPRPLLGAGEVEGHGLLAALGLVLGGGLVLGSRHVFIAPSHAKTVARWSRNQAPEPVRPPGARGTRLVAGRWPTRCPVPLWGRSPLTFSSLGSDDFTSGGRAPLKPPILRATTRASRGT